MRQTFQVFRVFIAAQVVKAKSGFVGSDGYAVGGKHAAARGGLVQHLRAVAFRHLQIRVVTKHLDIYQPERNHGPGRGGQRHHHF